VSKPVVLKVGAVAPLGRVNFGGQGGEKNKGGNMEQNNTNYKGGKMLNH